MQDSPLACFLFAGSIPAIPIDASYYEWRQRVDHRGRPRGKPTCGRWHFATGTLSQAQYAQLTHYMLSATAQLDAHAEYGRSDGQGQFVTVWGTGCYVSHLYDYFDSRGTDGREPGWRLFFTLAPQEMGRTAGAKGAFVAPQSREYAAPRRTTAATPKPAAALPAPEYTLVEFRATIWDADQVAPSVIEELYQHFNAAKTGPDSTAHWAAMEHLIRHSTFPNPKTGAIQTLNGGWPPANGGYNKRLVQPAPPDKFDRYEKKAQIDARTGEAKLMGKFTSPVLSSGAFDYEARALEGREEEYDLMYEINILKPLPFEGEEAEIIPWHGHTGNGVQTRMLFPPYDPIINDFPWSWEKLQKEGYISIVYKASPNGRFLISPDGSQAIIAKIS